MFNVDMVTVFIMLLHTYIYFPSVVNEQVILANPVYTVNEHVILANPVHTITQLLFSSRTTSYQGDFNHTKEIFIKDHACSFAVKGRDCLAEMKTGICVTFIFHKKLVYKKLNIRCPEL